MLIQSLRPQSFSQVVGNQINNKILLTLAKNPTKGPRTILLQGLRGSGKTTSARIFAKALNCKCLKSNDICGSCDVCLSDLNNVSWYTEYDASSIGNVETLREIRDTFITTSKKYKKVVVIDECHLLSRASQSSLLKVFEETPSNIYFLLATTDPDKLLPTIRSRSLELTFIAKSVSEVKDNIRKHSCDLGFPLSEHVLDLIANRSKGIMRDAHMLLDKVMLLGEEEFLKTDIPTTSLFNKYIVSILKSDSDSVLQVVSDLSCIPVAYLKDDWQNYFLSLLKYSICPENCADEQLRKIIGVLGKGLVNFTKVCTQDWVIKSFQSSVQAQTAMLAIYQMFSKNNR